MAEHANVTLFKKGYEAFSTGDMDTLRGLFSHDVVWHQPGKNPLSGDHKGVDSVLGLFMKLAQETDGTFKVEPHDFLGNDEHVVVLATVTGTRKGKHVHDRYAQIAHVRGGKATEVWVFQEHQDLLDAFFA